ncbi:MAG TPA: hypothetical protein VH575_12860 [Gemmataceae bacterium]|jgi:hypothetical protein
MKNRICRLFVEIDNGQTKRYQLFPLAGADLGPDFAAGFRLVNRTDQPEPIYHVRLTTRGEVSCTCPAFHWDREKGKSPNAPPHQPAPTCKHCDALRAAGLLPVALVELIQKRTRQLDRAERLLKNRDLEREAACRNADSLRATIAQLEAQLRNLNAFPIQQPTSRHHTRKAKAA